MVCPPLVFKVVQFVDIGHHHVISFDSHTPDVAVFCYTETGAKRNNGIDSKCLIDDILKVIILAQIQALNRQLPSECLQPVLWSKRLEVLAETLPDPSVDLGLLNHVAEGVRDSGRLSECPREEESDWLVDDLLVVVHE